jgi:hypothetical protein
MRYSEVRLPQSSKLLFKEGKVMPGWIEEGSGGPRPLSYELKVRSIDGGGGHLRGAVYMGDRVEPIDAPLPYERAVAEALEVLILLSADTPIEAELRKGKPGRLRHVGSGGGGTDIMMWDVQGTSGAGSSGGPPVSGHRTEAV